MDIFWQFCLISIIFADHTVREILYSYIISMMRSSMMIRRSPRAQHSNMYATSMDDTKYMQPHIQCEFALSDNGTHRNKHNIIHQSRYVLLGPNCFEYKIQITQLKFSENVILQTERLFVYSYWGHCATFGSTFFLLQFLFHFVSFLVSLLQTLCKELKITDFRFFVFLQKKAFPLLFMNIS